MYLWRPLIRWRQRWRQRSHCSPQISQLRWSCCSLRASFEPRVGLVRSAPHEGRLDDRSLRRLKVALSKGISVQHSILLNLCSRDLPLPVRYLQISFRCLQLCSGRSFRVYYTQFCLLSRQLLPTATVKSSSAGTEATSTPCSVCGTSLAFATAAPEALLQEIMDR